MAPLALPLFRPVMWSTLPPPQVQQAACAEKPFFHKSSKPLGCEETPASMWISHGLDWCNQWFRCPTTNSAWILSTNRISCLSSYALSRCFAVHQALHIRCEQSSPPKTSKKSLNGKELMPFAERFFLPQKEQTFILYWNEGSIRVSPLTSYDFRKFM